MAIIMSNVPQFSVSQASAPGAEPELLMDEPQDRLDLDSRLSELGRVQPWADALADRYGLTDDTRYAVNLCLEEALANVVLHGYQDEPGHRVTISYSVSGGLLFISIEDNAPPFEPVDPSRLSGTREPLDLETMQPGGNGILLIHRFARSVTYEQLPHGNRLTMGFPVPVGRNMPA